jgi:hypothetical protein
MDITREKNNMFICIGCQLKGQNDSVRTAISEPSRVRKFDGTSHVECLQSDEQLNQGLCYATRSQQFQALWGVTVKLMDSGHNLLDRMNSLEVSDQRRLLHFVSCGRHGVTFIDSKPWKSECVQDKNIFFCELLNWKVHSSPPWFSISKFL